MGRACLVCAHPRRSDIDLELARGVQVPDIVRRYELPENSVYRHRAKKHVPISVVNAFLEPRSDLTPQALARLRREEASSVLLTLAEQRSILKEIQTEGRKRRRTPVVLAAAKEILKNVESTARVIGLFAEHERAVNITTSVSLLSSEEYVTFRSKLLQALSPHAAAREALGQVLAEIEGEPPHWTGKHPRQLEGKATNGEAESDAGA